jgi:hypothetical protein
LEWQSNPGHGYLLVLIGEGDMIEPLLGDKQYFLGAVV